MNNLPKILQQIFWKSPNNLFDAFVLECQKNYEKPAHSLAEMKKRENKKIRGDIFEEFCVLYLKHVKSYSNVWRLPDVPDEILLKLNMKRRDMGIDIICENNGIFSAVQCKYKKPCNTRKHCVTWKELSTFYALCLKTQIPWEKYIVMTNCEYVTHMGQKTEKDQSICIGTFRNISKDEWIKMSGITGNLLGETNENIIVNESKQLSQEEIRERRIAYFESKNII